VDELIEGRNAVLEALRAGLPIHRIVLAEGLHSSDALAEIQRLADDGRIALSVESRRVLDEMSARGAHQGVIAALAAFDYTSLADVVERNRDEAWSLIVALDHVTDPQNLGAIARSAEVAGAHALVIPERRSAAVGAAAFKTSAGALAHLEVVRTVNLVRALGELKDAGYWVAGASEHAEQTVWEAPIEGRTVLVLGGEGTGLSRLAEESCDYLVRLPVRGRTGSLNVANAATALMFEWVRRLESSE